jgi:hypothetical protein
MLDRANGATEESAEMGRIDKRLKEAGIEPPVPARGPFDMIEGANPASDPDAGYGRHPRRDALGL